MVAVFLSCLMIFEMLLAFLKEILRGGLQHRDCQYVRIHSLNITGFTELKHCLSLVHFAIKTMPDYSTTCFYYQK